MRVVIAEDAAVLREGLVRLLTERGHEICAAVANAEAMRAAVTEHQPDAVIADIRMPPTHTDDGLRAAVAVRRDFPSIGVLLFSQYIETRYTARLLETGAGGIGYLLKDRVGNVAEFVSALERVAAGGTALDPEVISQLLRKPDPGLASLTPREREVLGVMAEGKSNSGIAATLMLSEGAVEKHIASIFGKLSLEPESAANRRVLAVLRYLRT
jgi:DNA-binding NarL/FixJ family response regulator